MPTPPRPDPARLQTGWEPTRAAGLVRLAGFVPRMGRHYASRRNHDLGPGARDNVSLLSPWISRRMLGEEEVIRACLAAHDPGSAEKFVQEVVWRSYFRGWLEHRPAVWDRYRAARNRLRHDLRGPDAAALARAEAGETGIDAFDAWARELTATGYLHNHARMWVASIWIFTLGLPWQLGADFFLRHLLDGDAASNTLGWRWVAGLHTPGKSYRADAGNIATFTAGRFRAEGLAAEAPARTDDPNPPAGPLPAADPLPDGPVAVLVTETDMQVEDLVDPRRMAAVATLRLSAHRSDLPVSEAVAGFDRGALADAAARLQRLGAPEAARLEMPRPADLADWAAGTGAPVLVVPRVPPGWVRDWLAAARVPLDRAGIRLVAPRRGWDDAVWPHATAGFFRVKERIPQILAARGIGTDR